jgi:hypothetical protein
MSHIHIAVRNLNLEMPPCDAVEQGIITVAQWCSALNDAIEQYYTMKAAAQVPAVAATDVCKQRGGLLRGGLQQSFACAERVDQFLGAIKSLDGIFTNGQAAQLAGITAENAKRCIGYLKESGIIVNHAKNGYMARYQIVGNIEHHLIVSENRVHDLRSALSELRGNSD